MSCSGALALPGEVWHCRARGRGVWRWSAAPSLEQPSVSQSTPFSPEPSSPSTINGGAVVLPGEGRDSRAQTRVKPLPPHRQAQHPLLPPAHARHQGAQPALWSPGRTGMTASLVTVSQFCGVQEHEEPVRWLPLLAQEHWAATGITGTSGAKREMHQLCRCTARGGWRRSDQCSPRFGGSPCSSVSLEQQAYELA